MSNDSFGFGHALTKDKMIFNHGMGNVFHPKVKTHVSTGPNKEYFQASIIRKSRLIFDSDGCLEGPILDELR